MEYNIWQSSLSSFFWGEEASAPLHLRVESVMFSTSLRTYLYTMADAQSGVYQDEVCVWLLTHHLSGAVTNLICGWLHCQRHPVRIELYLINFA